MDPDAIIEAATQLKEARAAVAWFAEHGETAQQDPEFQVSVSFYFGANCPGSKTALEAINRSIPRGEMFDRALRECESRVEESERELCRMLKD